MAPARSVDEEYRRGYLTGMIRGDGHVGSYSYERPGRSYGDVHRFRLALADDEALERAQSYLRGFAIETSRFVFAEASGAHRAIAAVRTSARHSVETVRELIAWPNAPTTSWLKGFLAGIFDAEGSSGGGTFASPTATPS